MSLIFHLLFSSLFLVSSSLFLSCLSVSLFLCLSLSLSLSFSPSPCDVVCCVLCGVCRCGRGVVVGRGVCLCVLRHAEKREKNRVWIQKRLRVCIQNVTVYARTTRTCVSTCARGTGTHGDVLNLHTEGVLYIHTVSRGSSSVLLTKFAHVLLSRDSEVHQRNQWIFTIFKCENRSRATRCRFLQTFAVPDEAVQFQHS